MSPAQRAFSRLFLVGLGATFALGIAELGVRMFYPQPTGPAFFVNDPQLGPIPVPNQKGRRVSPGSYDHTYTNDSDGLRVTGPAGDSETPKTKILFLGDSFTYGFGVNDDETFAWKVQTLLSDSRARAKVTNGGCGGTGTDYDLRFFQVRADKIKPDITVLCFLSIFFDRDQHRSYFEITRDGKFHPRDWSTSMYARKAWLTRSAPYTWLSDNSQLLTLMKHDLFLLLRHSPAFAHNFQDPALQNNSVAPYANDSSIKLTKVFLHELIRETRYMGSQFLVFYIPLLEEVEHQRETGQISVDELAFRNLVASEGAMLVSFTPILAKSTLPLSQLYFPEGHWTKISHALAARVMAEAIADHEKLKP